MVSVVYKSLSSLSPIELKYQYNKDEELASEMIEYSEGYLLHHIDGLKDFQDLAVNKNSCFVLTSAIDLDLIFKKENQLSPNKINSTIVLQPRNSYIYFAEHIPSSNTFQLQLTSASNFFIEPINTISGEIELLVNNKYVQVDENYPFTVRLNEKPLDPESIHRQRFETFYERGFISFKTKTNQGYRYLAFNNDNILRAVGVVFNDSVVNDYIFKCISVTNSNSPGGFIPHNNWVTYYFDIESQTQNKTLTINKDIQKVPTNLLLDFSIENATGKATSNVNIANLKTQITPAGGPAPIENSYDKQVITKN
jgi:hypothetical protein